MLARPRIVLLHATPIAIAPIQAAFAQHWPQAETVNLLDDALTLDRAKETELSASLTVSTGTELTQSASS
jgi:hypothetical protein